MSRFIDIHTHYPTGRHIEPQGIGIHPWQADNSPLPAEEEFASAELIGEVGLDYVCGVNRQVQESVLRQQLAIAQRLSKPVVLHCVRAFEPMMNILKEYELKGVIFHGFIGSKEQALAATKRGYYISFGAGTIRSPKTIEALRNTPLEKMFSESDESGLNIEDIYAEIARLKGVETEELKAAILNNYNNIFL